MEILEAKENQSDATGEQSSITSNVEKESIDPPIFKCLEGEFTLRVLQGQIPKVLLNMNNHPKITQKQIEEDLAVLDEI